MDGRHASAKWLGPLVFWSKVPPLHRGKANLDSLEGTHRKASIGWPKIASFICREGTLGQMAEDLGNLAKGKTTFSNLAEGIDRLAEGYFSIWRDDTLGQMVDALVGLAEGASFA
ncbi:hypothetical protein FNV43_RR16942 [Rhamnella rubrinervis]|uniref:Uncharacterized protein n=1 Tax=Rhamnella rubrinervis TaxID=2594499 RepID=A0A8K0GZQ9_9ROSA|nr:hypothetical protein FNV43_RR16942 [Rhamnella rubrinervis]